MRISDWSSDVCSSDFWTTLGGYLDHLAARGIAPNVASYVGAATVREMVLGDAATDPTPAQVQAMQGIVRQAMDEGAMGVASALIYAPGVFAKTPELIALAHAAGRCGGLYATHLRSEDRKSTRLNSSH